MNKTASKVRFRLRHFSVFFSFLVFVVAPVFLSSWYLIQRAQDQYTSTFAFSVRSEEMGSAFDFLGGLSALGSSGSSDTDILYEFVMSRAIVDRVQNRLDLRLVYSFNNRTDPWFSFDPNGTIEDLSNYWNDMVKVFYDRNTGIIEVRVHAFRALDAQKIAQIIVEESTQKINDLSAISRLDTIKYAEAELNASLARLKLARKAMTEFRSLNELVDPEAELGVQTGLLSALQGELSSLLIESDVLADIANIDDPRRVELKRRIEIVENRIEVERSKFSSQGLDKSDYSKLLGEYESLLVDREYAEQAYLASMATYDSAVMEANRKSRYLATYIEPTFAERAEYPQKELLVFLIFTISLFGWATLVLLYYALRDRR